MMNNYIFAELDEKKNSFFVKASIMLFGTKKVEDIEIDTGCSYSNIAFKKFFQATDEEALNYKKNAIISHTPYVISFGASDTNDIIKEQRELIKAKKFLNCKSVSYVYQVTLNLSGYIINHDIRVNYDRDGNSLLGMDILKDFDFHIGVSRVTGKSTFIGCLKDRINSEYLDALYQHFGYLSEDACKEICQQVQTQTYLNAVQQAYRAGSWRDYIDKQKKLTALQNKIKRNGEVIR